MGWGEGEDGRRKRKKRMGEWSGLVGDSGRWEAMVSTCPVNDQNCYLSMIQNYPDCGWGEEEEQRRGEESDSVNHTAGSTGMELCV